MITFLGQTLLPFLVVAAAISDISTMRIPNWLNAIIALAFFPMALASGMAGEAILWHAVAGIVVLVVGFGLFSAGWIGGGDAKLLAAAALWVGWTQLPQFIVLTAIAGGILAIVMKAWRMLQVEGEVHEIGWARRLLRGNMDLPYGVAIAAGTILAFPGTWWMPLAS